MSTPAITKPATQENAKARKAWEDAKAGKAPGFLMSSTAREALTMAARDFNAKSGSSPASDASTASDPGGRLATLQAENASLRKQLEANKSEAKGIVTSAAGAAVPDVNELAKAIVREQESLKNPPSALERFGRSSAEKEKEKQDLEARYQSEKPSFDHLHGKARMDAAGKHRADWLANERTKSLASAIVDEQEARDKASKIRTREQFREMNPTEKNEFFRNGGKLVNTP